MMLFKLKNLKVVANNLTKPAKITPQLSINSKVFSINIHLTQRVSKNKFPKVTMFQPQIITLMKL